MPAIPWTILALLAIALCVIATGCNEAGSGGSSGATSLDPPAEPEPPGDQPAFPFIDHVDQANVTDGFIGFEELFILGDEIFETQFNSIDGVGILELPDGTPLPSRFSRVPPGGGRFTGPNGQACNGCHNTPFGTSAGSASSNVLQDPALDGVGPFNLRNTPSLLGSGLVQRLAEETTTELLGILDTAVAAAAPAGPVVTLDLVAKGISFGRISTSRDAGGALTVDTTEVEGVAPDLVVRPFGLKGNSPSVREFSRGAAFFELGMQGDELVAKDPQQRTDPDADGVEGELSVGDVTAIVVYVAAQETPTTVDRMVRDGRMTPPGSAFAAQTDRGRELFAQIGCERCHVPELRLIDTLFEEPTARADGHYFDADLLLDAPDLDPTRPFRFDLARQGDFPRPTPHASGGLRVQLFGDLRHHNMGAHLADPQETPVVTASGSDLMVGGSPVTVPRSTFVTAELWGVGSTGPWLHDGRAGSLGEAIELHGVDNPPIGPDRSEAQDERDNYVTLSDVDREAVVTFLKSLILFEDGEEE